MTGNATAPVILACRPVEWSARTLGPGANMPETPIYADSVVERCSTCNTEIYVGPRLQEAMRSMHPEEYVLVCFLCSLNITATAGGPHAKRTD